MTILEKKSERKKKAIMQLVISGEYSIAFAMMEAERLNDEGKLLDNDYEELAEWLESQLEPVEEVTENFTEDTESFTEIDTGEETGNNEEPIDTDVATTEETSEETEVE